MTDQSVFAEQEVKDQGQPAQETPSVNPFADQLASIKTEEGKQKYATIEEAIKGLAHSQQYIPELKGTLSEKEQEIASLRAELEKREAVEQVVSRLSQTQEPVEQVANQQPMQQGLTQEDVEKLVASQLSQVEAQKTQSQNLESVNSSIRAKYGENASKVVQDKAAELGTTPQELQKLASQNPAMVMALFNTKANTTAKPTTGSYNISVTDTPAPVLEKPAKSVLSGASSADQKEYMAKVKADVYARLGIQG
jgi:DNA repair exonuclease SbcCD ATPase subunit